MITAEESGQVVDSLQKPDNTTASLNMLESIFGSMSTISSISTEQTGVNHFTDKLLFVFLFFHVYQIL